MLKEIGLASSMLGGVLDMFKTDKKDKTDEVSGTEEFGALMAGGMSIASLPTAAPADEDKVYGMDDGTKEALAMLRDMTSGGLEGAMRWAMKQLREDVMESMGISEAELAAMPADQKAAVEKAIAEEIQKRMAEAMGKEKDGGLAAKAMTPEEMIAGIQKALQEAAKKAYKEEVPTV